MTYLTDAKGSLVSALKGFLMIKLTSFYPFPSWLRITQEFKDDKIVVTQKSLTAEVKFDVKYEQIAYIKYVARANASHTTAGLITVGALSLISIFFCKALYGNPILLAIMQVLLPLTILLSLLGLRKSQYCDLANKANGVVMTIQMDYRNMANVISAIEFIKQKNLNTEELDIDEPFLDSESLYELVELNLPDFASKSTIKFYETELIDYESSLVEESIRKVKYDSIRQIIHAKKGNDSWGTISSYFFLLTFVISGTRLLYSLPKVIDQIMYRSFWPLLIISILLLLLGYFKKEYIFLVDGNENTLEYTAVSKNNKEKIEQILEFIESKIGKNA